MSEELKEAITVFKRLDEKREEGLTEEEERSWNAAKETIERHSSDPMPPSSRRRALRVPSELEVTFEDARGFQRAYLRNISEGGVYVATELDLRMRDRFQLRILVRDPDETIELPVEVVWVNRTPSPSSGLAPGVGVAWLELQPEKKLAIKRIIHSALDDLKR
jgi:uncharacterized protein (TIGR02266 family)